MAPAKKPVVVGVVLVVGLGIGLTTATSQRGESAPSVVARSLRNGHEKIDVPGPPGRPAVIVFFASWCRLCEGELRNVEFVRREVGGHVDFLCEQSVSVAESVLAGSVKAFAVSAAKRLETLPDVPTAGEAGINYEMSVWAGLFAPKGVSPEIIARLSDALDRALDEAVVRERIAQLGGSIPAKDERNPAAFDRFVRSEIARWSPMLAAAGTRK